MALPDDFLPLTDIPDPLRVPLQRARERLAASLEQSSEHPLASAIVEDARARGIELIRVEQFHSITGRGVTGRVSGRPHEIEIWFGMQNNILYLLSGSETSDWVKNLLKTPSVTVRIAKHVFTGTARLVQDKEEDRIARYLLAEKYQEWEEGKTLSEWARTALPVAIELTLNAGSAAPLAGR